jgi:hypothetical protein
MKSVKMFFGMMLCLVVLAGQAQAVILDFEDGLTLAEYGEKHSVEFTGDWNLVPISSDTKLLALNYFDEDVVAGINFFPSFKVDLTQPFSFNYSLTTNGVAEVVGLTNNGYVTKVLSVGKDMLSSDWAGIYLSSLEFTLKAGALTVDNISYTATPLPGAAILLGSGLLGLVGLRRREII